MEVPCKCKGSWSCQGDNLPASSPAEGQSINKLANGHDLEF